MKFNQFGGLQRIHFVGIGGIGMSGIAKVLFHNGYTVSGSDIATNSITENLIDMGIHVHKGHSESNLDRVDVVVISSAIEDDNVEVIAAHSNKIPVLSRAEMLGELMRFKFGIAVSGTHGKTTTTSLVAHIFKEASLDPTYVIGGIVNSTANNADIGKGDYLVTEADESDASFVALSPMITVVTNIDDDHMSTYGDNKSSQDEMFLEFIQKIPFYGKAILCGDDARLNSLLPIISRPFVTYGFSAENDFIAKDIQQTGLVTKFIVERPSLPPLNITLNLPGEHNVLNALAAIAVANTCHISDSDICSALASFAGIARRFQVLGNLNLAGNNITFIDDYAHHPAELAATLKTAKNAFPGKKITMVFQPHRFSRTKSLWKDFVTVLSQNDNLVLLPIYTAGESEISEITIENLSKDISTHSEVNVCLADSANLLDTITEIIHEDGIVVAAGAGSISKITRDMISSSLDLV